MSNKVKFFWAILINCLFYLNTYAQLTDYNVFELSFLYDETRFEQILDQTNHLLKNKTSLNKNQLIEIHKYRALAFFNLGKQDSARINFFSLLSLDKNYTLDAVKISPKIISFYNEIKINFEHVINQPNVIRYDNYIFVEDIRPYAALRSLAFPGWGQHFKNQKTKGYLINGSFAVTAIAGIISYSLERNLRDDYLSAGNRDKIQSLYSDYNNMSKTRRVFQYMAITIWAYALVDVMYTDYVPVLETNNGNVELSLNISF